MTSTEEIQDFVEYLVEERGVRSITELTRAEQYKLAFWVLIKNKMYMDLIKLMQQPFNEYLASKRRAA